MIASYALKAVAPATDGISSRKEMRAAAYEKLMEATQLLASAGLTLLAEEVEELALQVDLQATD